MVIRHHSIKALCLSRFGTGTVLLLSIARAAGRRVLSASLVELVVEGVWLCYFWIFVREMPPKKDVKSEKGQQKSLEKQKLKIAEDKTFGLKNKNKSSKVQKCCASNAFV